MPLQIHKKLGAGLILTAVLVSVDASDAASNAVISELQALSGSVGLALARITGNDLVVHPFLSNFQKRSFGLRFLSARFGPSGVTVIGLADWTSNPANTDPASVLICDQHGKVLWRTNALTDVSALALAPDGARFATISTNRSTGFKGLQVVSLKGEFAVDAIQIEPWSTMLHDDITWSSDSTQLLFSKGNEVRLCDIGTRRSRAFVIGAKPSWSPDGTWIAFLSKRSRLVLRNSSSGVDVYPSRDRISTSAAVWSPDSRWFAVEEDRDRRGRNPNCYANSRIVVYRATDFAHADVLDPCSLKPELFGWVLDWQHWGSE